MPAASPEAKPAARPARRRRSLPARIGLALGVIAAVLVLLVAGIRFGAVTDPGRNLIVGVVDGLSIGRYGKLEVSGLEGDVFGDVKIGRVAIVDRDGVWLEGRDVTVRYRAVELLSRRFHATRIEAGLVRGLRQPNPEPPDGTPEKPLPVRVDIDAARLRLETLPALSRERGLYDVSASIDMERVGPWVGRVEAASLLRRGDGLNARFRVKDKDRFQVFAKAVEAQGGAIAGIIGLSPDRPFRLDATVDGAADGGVVSVLAQSGDDRPAEARGRWSKAGGSVSGRASLAASTLTRLLAEQFGPEVSFDVSGRRSGGDLYDIILNARAENLDLAVSGPVDAVKQTSQAGLRVRAAVDDLSRLIAFPPIGSGLAEGVLRAGVDDFTFKGRALANDIVTPTFSLAQIAGPVTVTRRKRDIDVEADVTGAGGRGEGFFAAWLGARPTVQTTVTLLADGRTLIRTLRARGPGLDVTASGTRGILGDLAFKGQATLSNLTAAAPGATGAFAGDWSARQARAGEPWRFDADARGRTFRSGLPELDRLLGGTPRLRAEGAYLANGDTRLERVLLDGASASGTARGVLTAAGGLGFDVDWRAQGPFAAGPIEISGTATGEGAIGGTLLAPRADLTAVFGAIDFPQLTVAPANLTLSFDTVKDGIDGRFALTGGSAYGPANARSAFRFVEGGVDLSNLALDAGGVQAAGRASLLNGQPTTADLTFAAGPGAFLVSGRAQGAVRLVDGAGEPSATLSLSGDDLVVRGQETTPVQRLRLTAAGPLSRLPFQLSLAAPAPQPVSFDGSGVFGRNGEVITLSLQGRGRVQEQAFATTEPLQFRFAPGDLSLRARLQAAGGTAAVDARQAGEVVTATAVLDGVDVAAFSPDFAGRVDARLTAEGRGARLTGALDATLDDARSLDAPANLAVDGRVQATLNDSRLRIAATAVNPAGLRAATNLDLPAEASAQPFRLAINRTQPIRGDFMAQGELRSLWDLFFGAERTLSGKLDAAGTIAGTLNAPRATGRANVADGAFRDAATGLELRDLTLAADLADTAVIVRQLTARDGGRGTLAGQGRIGLTQNAASTFRVDLTRFQFLDGDLGEATASGRVEVDRDARGANTLTGKLVIDKAEISAKAPNAAGVVTIDVVEINKPVAAGVSRQARAAPAAAGPAVALNVEISAPRGIFVRGQGVDIELSLDARVRGTTAAPDLSGVARVVRGTYEFAGKRFEFDDRSTVRLATLPANIRLDLTATRDDPALTANVRVTGTAEAPLVALTSTPSLPQDEILSNVLFGRSASQLTPIEAAQLAAALTSLATGGGFDVVGGLRSIAGLDRLALSQGVGGTTVAGGKYLTDDVYLELIGGGREGPQAEIEYRVRRNLAIVSRIGGADNRLSVRYRRNF